MVKLIFEKKSIFQGHMKVIAIFFKMESYDFFTWYDSSHYSAYKRVKIKLSKNLFWHEILYSDMKYKRS